MNDSAQHLAPWWFSGTIGVIGVVVGLVLKSALDAVASRTRNQREDSLRFLQDKRIAYADLLAACHEVADVEHAARGLAKRNQEMDERSFVPHEDVDDYNRAVDANAARRTEAYREVNRSAAVVELIGPEDAVMAASVLISRAHHPHLLPSRVEAESAYTDAVRRDLGYRPTSHLPGIPYEPYISSDHPDSGV